MASTSNRVPSRAPHKSTQFYQGSSLSIGNVHDPTASTKGWVTQTALDYAAPPPVDLDTLLRTRHEGAERLKDLRRHKFVIGSQDATVEEERTPVSRDIGNYKPDHIAYVKRSIYSTNYKGTPVDPATVAHLGSAPAWFQTDGASPRPVTAPVAGQGQTQATAMSTPGPASMASFNPALPPVAGAATPAFQRERDTSSDSHRDGFAHYPAPQHDGIAFRQALIRSHWRVGTESVQPDYRTSNKIAYEERTAPHPENKKGFKGSWHQVKHTIYKPDSAPAVAAGGGGSSSVGLANVANPHGGVDTKVLTWSSQARFYKMDQEPRDWKTTQHADYVAYEGKSGRDIAEQKAYNFQRTQAHKYESHISLSYKDPAAPELGTRISETHQQFQKPASDAYATVRANPAAATAASLSYRFSSNIFRPATADSDAWRTTYMKDMSIPGFTSRLF